MDGGWHSVFLISIDIGFLLILFLSVYEHVTNVYFWLEEAVGPPGIGGAFILSPLAAVVGFALLFLRRFGNVSLMNIAAAFGGAFVMFVLGIAVFLHSKPKPGSPPRKPYGFSAAGIGID